MLELSLLTGADFAGALINHASVGLKRLGQLIVPRVYMSKAHNLPFRMAPAEAFAFAYDALRVSKAHTMLTALGMVVGTAALILVVTIGMTGNEYVLRQINGIGVNWIFAEYQGGAQRIIATTPDQLTINDMKVVLQEVPEIVAASPIVALQVRVHFY